MAKVKDYKNWKKIRLEDRVILKGDLRYMSWQQVRSLDELEVVLVEDGGKTLIVNNKS